MPATRKSSQTKPKRSELAEPDVIVDFIFDDGLFFIAISNLSDRAGLRGLGEI